MFTVADGTFVCLNGRCIRNALMLHPILARVKESLQVPCAPTQLDTSAAGPSEDLPSGSLKQGTIAEGWSPKRLQLDTSAAGSSEAMTSASSKRETIAEGWCAKRLADLMLERRRDDADRMLELQRDDIESSPPSHGKEFPQKRGRRLKR